MSTNDIVNLISMGISLVALALNLYVYILNKRIDKEIRESEE